MNLTEGDKRKMAVGAAIVAPLGAMVVYDQINSKSPRKGLRAPTAKTAEMVTNRALQRHHSSRGFVMSKEVEHPKRVAARTFNAFQRKYPQALDARLDKEQANIKKINKKTGRNLVDDLLGKPSKDDVEYEKRLNKAVRMGQQAARISNLTTRHVVNAEKNLNRRMDEIQRQVNTGETQKPAKGANQNNPPKNVRYMGNTSGGYKMGDPRITDDTYQRFAQKQVAKAERSFRAVHQLNKKLNEPNVKNYEQARDAARQNKDVPKPKAANTNYTKKALNAIKTMGRVIKGSSIIGAISYAASSTPVGDATLDGKKYTNYKYTPNK